MFKSTSIVLGTALLAALALAAGEADAADACIPAKVREALADCSASATSPAMPAADLLVAAAQLQARTLLRGLPGGKRAAKGTGRQLAPRELYDDEAKLDAAFHRFLCDDKPGPGDTKAAEQHAEMEYARARLHFVANRFAESATMFRAVALHHADLPVGIHASQLYLDSLNALGGEGATSCYDDMASDVPVLVGLYCKDGKEKVNAEQCGTMNAISRDILRLHAEQQVKEGEKGGADGRGGSSAYEAGALSYLQIWERYGRAQCEAKSPGCQRMEEILDNAARAYQGARKSHEAIAVRKVMLEPRYNLDNTELAQKAAYEIGRSYQAMAFYEEAASWYEIHARKSPKSDRAPEALQDALVLRLGLDQLAQAEVDGDLFSKNHGSRKPRDTANIAFAIAGHVLDRGDREGARQRLEASMAMFDRNGTIDVQMLAHAMLGRVFVLLDKQPKAAVEYGKVRALYRDPAGVLRKIQEAYGHGEERPLARALTAVGEATFFFAEEKRRAADAIPLPIYTGTGQRDDVAAHVSGPLSAWLTQRRAAIGEAEKAYVEAVGIEPAAPPKWVVLGAARVARMHGRLAAQLLSVPFPKGWKEQGPSPWGPTWEAIRADFRGALAQLSDPVGVQAKAAYRSCARLAVSYHYFDERAQACGAWLSSHYPAEFPRDDEIRDRPSHRYFAIEPGLPARGITLDP